MKKFYELTFQERRRWLKNQHVALMPIDAVQLERADHLSENVFSTLTLPVGLIPDLVVNGSHFQVPMATEEPSVIAGANHGSRFLMKAGGSHAFSFRSGIWGQIVLKKGPSFSDVRFQKELVLLKHQTNQKFDHLVRHGGGVRKFSPQFTAQKINLRVLIDPSEAMGANLVNTILEFMADELNQSDLTESKSFAIVSNYPSQLTKVNATLPVSLFGKNSEGLKVATDIEALSDLSGHDVYRAVTNNKGIMNGVDAVLMATGNDTRAVEASNAVLACHHGQYTSLSHWHVSKGILKGQLTLSLPLGVVGGSIEARPDVKQNLQLMSGNENFSARDLAQIIASVGLASNLAALHAIVTSGIQAGHMKLQARNLVAALSATDDEKKQVYHLLTAKHVYTATSAKDFLKKVRQGEKENGHRH